MIEKVLLNRRRFLKYAAVGAAIAGSAVAGYEFDRWQESLVPPQVTTTTLTETQTLTQTATETVSLASLSGRLFFDYNGNGVQDGEEPAVAGASVQLKDSSGSVIAQALTDSSGEYKLEDVRTGDYRLQVVADKKFRYMCRSAQEFTKIAEGYSIVLDRSQSMDIGLMEGFLTLPFKRGTSFQWGCYFDEGDGKNIDWAGQGRTRPEWHNGPSEGNDMLVSEGTPVVTGAPGTVAYVDDWNPYWKGQGIFIIISHYYNNYYDNMSSLYAHVDKSLVTPGQVVPRGYTLGLSGGEWTIAGPHLHYELDWGIHGAPIPGRDTEYIAHDIFKSTWNSDFIGYWTKLTPDNDPQYSV
jgi:murein DD-endopeptidase MepM/ murein hydrolase activator NlpD